MALPVAAALTATATAAALAYVNAKHHILHDLRSSTLTGNSATALAYINAQVAKQQLLTYDVFAERASQQPSHPFLIFEGRTWTYREFFQAVNRVGRWLSEELGVRCGEIVAVDGGNSPEYLMLWFALDGLGAAPSFINWNLTGGALVYSVKLCDARYLICDQDVRTLVEPCVDELREAGIRTLYYGSSSLSSLPASPPLDPSLRAAVTPDSIKGLIYTSGTTGLPKATIMRAARELLLGHWVAGYLRLSPSTRFYTCMPLYHGAAHGLGVTPVVHGGATLVLGRKFSHATFWPEVCASRATVIQYVGELCRYLLNAPPGPLDRAHCVQMAWGNGMRPDVWAAFQARFGIPVINELYAATDGLGPMFNESRGEFSRDALAVRGALWRWRYGANEVAVKVDPDTQEMLRDGRGFAIKCRVGEPGEVIHKLDPSMPADVYPSYYNDRGASEKRKIRDVFQKGDLWFRSGDMMRTDADGRVFFVDRLGDTFRWKSENVSTNEVADVLGRFPQVAEVNVYGVQVPNTDGRAGCAAFVLADGVAEEQLDLAALAEHALGRLPRYAVPIFVRLTKALEYTGTLKLQKGKLRAEGVDVEKVEAAGDKLFWLGGGNEGRKYVPFRRKDWEALKGGQVRL